MGKFVICAVLFAGTLFGGEVEDSIQELIDLKSPPQEAFQSSVSIWKWLFSSKSNSLEYSKMLHEIRPNLAKADLTKNEYKSLKKVCRALDSSQNKEALAIASKEFNPNRWLGIARMLVGIGKLFKKDISGGIEDLIKGFERLVNAAEKHADKRTELTRSIPA